MSGKGRAKRTKIFFVKADAIIFNIKPLDWCNSVRLRCAQYLDINPALLSQIIITEALSNCVERIADSFKQRQQCICF